MIFYEEVIGTVRRNLRVGCGHRPAEPCIDARRLDERHVHAEALDLGPQRVREGLHGELAGVVRTRPERGKGAADGAYVDDAPPPLAAHPRQNELRESHQPEHVRLELPPDVLYRQGLNRTVLSVPRVIDEHVHRAVFSFNLRYRVAHRSLVGYVELHGAKTLPPQLL